MKYLNKKFGKDIVTLWKQFISVIVMATLSVAIYCGMSTVWTGMGESYCDYKDKTNLADAYITGIDIKEDKISKIKKLSYVKYAEGSMLVKYSSTINGTETDIYVNSFTKKSKKLMNPMIRSGKSLKEEKEGIWIDEDYAKSHKLKVSDKISIKFNGMKKKVKILGIVLDAENIYFVTSSAETVPDHNSHGYAYVSESCFQKLLGFVSYNQVRLNLSAGSVSKKKLEKDIKNIMGDSFLSVVMKDDRISITQVDDEIDQIRKMAVLFSAVFILLSILSIYTTMSRLISNQMVQIGTLQSLGFYNRQIYIHYGFYGFLIAAVGSLAGIIIGYTIVANLVMNIKKATLTLPVWNKVFGIDSLILILLIISVCTLAAVLTTRKVVKNNPSFTINGILDKKSTEGDVKYKKSNLSYDWLWAIRSIKIHPARTLMSITAIMGSVVLMVAGMGVWDSLYSSYNQVYKEEFCYKYIGQVQEPFDNKITKRFDAYNVQFGEIQSADFSCHGKEKEGALWILESGKMIKLFDVETKKNVKLKKNDAVISSQLAEKLSVKVGNRIKYKLNSSAEVKKMKITGIVDAKMPQGIFVNKDKFKKFKPNTIYIGDKAAYKKAEKEDNISNLMSIKKQKNNMKEMMDSVHSIMYILILAAFVLSVVILYNLGILSCLERYREYATMKVIGFHNGEITMMVFKESFINLAVGLLIGIPLSRQFLKLYINVVSMDSMEWTPLITTSHFMMVIGGVIGFSVIVNLIVARKISKIDMVEALKSVE